MTTDPRPHAPSRTGWFKSSFSPSQGGCVEVRFEAAAVLVRDTKDRGEGPTLTIDIAAWPGFLDEVTGIAPAGSNHALHIEPQDEGDVRLRAFDGTTLTYTATEWSAFTNGVAAGQFTLHPVA
ncbi:protein of unknown function [Amycolatopsis marina]|uniref:DUF397 domain-containing protein n=1 Tax=Amycolatopsis marina TaxID=490629 RepID=A0A1I1CKG1_9PSEU|nr:DUF397 domain-containing protein [Amycolatopsis marina]SFB63175.1 protein of unknown function [Amycolatopsis marina]